MLNVESGLIVVSRVDDTWTLLSHRARGFSRYLHWAFCSPLETAAHPGACHETNASRVRPCSSHCCSSESRQRRCCSPPTGSTALSTFFADAVSRGDVPGVVALVVDRDKVLYHEAFGKMNIAKNVPMAKDTIFRIASMTKAVTSVGVMQLVEQGKVGLDDDVSKFMPRLKSPHVFGKVDEQRRHLPTRSREEVDHDSPAADAHVRHRLLVVGSRTQHRAEEDRRHQRLGAAARARAGRAVDLRREHARAWRADRDDDRRADRRLSREAHPRAARHARHELHRSGRPNTRASSPTNQKANGTITEDAESRPDSGDDPRRRRAVLDGGRLQPLRADDAEPAGSSAACGFSRRARRRDVEEPDRTA